MSQQGVLSDVETVASPLCIYVRCSRKGRAVLGDPRDCGGCVNRTIRCLGCGATGEQSTRKDLAKP
jgi:hypothetical protein